MAFGILPRERAGRVMVMDDEPDIRKVIRMPKVNGVEAIRYFRQQYPALPLVVLTGFPDVHMATSLLKEGVVDYLVKPVEKDTLIATIKKAVESREMFKNQFAT